MSILSYPRNLAPSNIAISVIFALITGYVSIIWAQSLDFTPPKPEGPAKIQSSLWGLVSEEQAAAKAVSPEESQGTSESVVVILVPHPSKGSASIDTSSFEGLGIEVLAKSKSLMRASVPASSLLAVSELPGISFVRRPYRPQPQQTISEGGNLINAYSNHLAGVGGQGVKVAIIDGGFKGVNQLGQDMPPSWWEVDYTDEGMYAGESAHGTACAEIVHDVAPEAELTILKVGDLVDLENAKDLCIRDGIEIISHSMGWFGTGIGDGRGTACNIVNDAADKGILWVNSAGNNAKSHYYGFWSDNDSNHESNNWHNFSPENEVLSFDADEGEEIRVFLTWNDWPNTRQNYDLYLYFNSTNGLERVVASTNRQNVFGGVPVERVEYIVDRSGEYGIAVRSEDARPRRLKIWSLNHDFIEHSVAENSIGSPADARGSMSVGAIYRRNWSHGQIEEYSSRGPTTDGRIKPDLVAPTGVSTVSYGQEFFGGTSAAAPHVAGAAALIKSANPSYSRTQFWNAVISAGVDIGIRGRDNESGYGKLVLPILQAAPSPRITSISPSRVRYNQVVTIRGANFGVERGESRVVFHGGQEPSSSQYASWSDTRVQVRVPTGARSGDLKVVTAAGSAAARLTITSPWVRNIYPQSGRVNTLVTIYGENFGTSRINRSVRIGRTAISSFSSWGNTIIRFLIPPNTRSGSLWVRTGEGSSNIVPIEITSPYLSQVAPARVKPGDRITLTGANFGNPRGAGYVLFSPNVRPLSADYLTWTAGRIVVKVPGRAESGDVKVVTAHGPSGARRIDVEKVEEPRITSVYPGRVKYNQVIAIQGSNFGAVRGAGKVIFYGGKEPSSFQYASWRDNQIRVRVPTGARTGNLQVVTTRGRDAARLTITSPWVRIITPQRGRANTLVAVYGENFGYSRGNSSVRIGSTTIPSFSTWSNTTLRFRIPVNARSGNLVVRTSEGSSNSLPLEVTSPFLSGVYPTRLKPGDRLTLTGANFRHPRGSGYVLFSPNVRPSSTGYVTWSDRRIVVEVPDRAASGDVKVVTLYGSSGTRRIEVEKDAIEPLPSTGIFGYSPPGLTKNPKRVRFGFEGIGEDVAMSWTLKNDSEVGIFINGSGGWTVPVSDDWKTWWFILSQAYLNSGQNVIEFRNNTNQYRSASYTHWQLKDVNLWRPFDAKAIAGARLLSSSSLAVDSGFGRPFPTPFNASVTIPITIAVSGQVRMSVYNLMGQQIRILRDGWTEAGVHQVRWDGRTDSGAEAASGVYWALLQSGEFTRSTKLVLLR